MFELFICNPMCVPKMSEFGRVLIVVICFIANVSGQVNKISTNVRQYKNFCKTCIYY